MQQITIQLKFFAVKELTMTIVHFVHLYHNIIIEFKLNSIEEYTLLSKDGLTDSTKNHLYYKFESEKISLFSLMFSKNLVEKIFNFGIGAQKIVLF